MEDYSEDVTQNRVAKLTSRQWPTGTRVQLLSVPWDSGYRDIVAFEDSKSQAEWFDEQLSRGWTNEHFAYLRPGAPIKVPVPYSSSYVYNYLTVENPAQPVDDEGPIKKYYYFITSCDYISPQASRLTLQLDVIQTYQFSCVFGNCFCVSGHAAMAHKDLQFDSPSDIDPKALQRYLSIPDGFDVGDRYNVCGREWISAQSRGTYILVVSTTDLAPDPGTIDNPNLRSSPGGIVDDLPSGCSVYAFQVLQFSEFVREGAPYPWVMQGIIAIYSFPGEFFESEDMDFAMLLGGKATGWYVGTTETITTESKPYKETGNVFEMLANGIPESYRHVWKLYTYPYSVIELSTFTGQSVFLKPEYLSDPTISLYAAVCCLEPFARVALFPKNYGANVSGTNDDVVFDRYVFASKQEGVIHAGDFLDNAVYLQDFPHFSIVNNEYIMYMASTAHTRQYQYDSAGWTQRLSNAQNQLSYDQAGRSIQASMQLKDVANDKTADIADVQSTAGLIGGVGGTIGNVLQQRGPVGMIGAALSGAANTAANQAEISGTSAAQINAANRSALINQQLNANLAGQNYDMANYATEGNYANEIAGILATTQDAALTPPSKVGQMGGDGFVWKNGLSGISISVRTAGAAQLAVIGQYFMRYGYQINRFITVGTLADMNLMEHFTYWKLKDSYLLRADANESERDTIRGVFERGVTIWHNPDEIGRVAIESNLVAKTVDY